MDANSKYDWVGFVVRFVCGGLLGALVLVILGTPSEMWWLVSVAIVLAFSILSGLFGDDFWERFLGFWGWWR